MHAVNIIYIYLNIYLFQLPVLPVSLATFPPTHPFRYSCSLCIHSLLHTFVQVLSAWGEKCSGCTSKTDYVNRINELRHKYEGKDEL